jgi:cytochrome c peroxidase
MASGSCRSPLYLGFLVLCLSLLATGCQSGEPGSLAVTPVSEAGAAGPMKIPLGLPALTVPEKNPITTEKVELGRMLYFDPRLSRNGKISCATCHDPKDGWAEHEPTSTGIGGQKGGRNAPTVINAAYATAQFWDGRALSLEEQALGPIQNPIEMGHQLPAMLQDLSKVPGYRERFKKVFGSEITKEGVAQAIAAFERTVLSGNSPYDRFKAGESNALSDAQKRGMEVFDNAGCSTCHAPPLFSTYEYYNAGVGMHRDKPDEGRKDVTKRQIDRGRFRVPSLREVAKTAPYFHDGSAATLDDAVALMAAGGKDNSNLSPMLKGIRESKLGAQDRKDLVEFLKALSGDYPVIDPPKLP